MEIVQWMIRNGAKHLLLIGRNQPSERALDIVNNLNKEEVSITIKLLDVASHSEMAKLFSDLKTWEYPLRGVFHAAGILDDALLENLGEQQFARVLSPKVLGAWNLHKENERPASRFLCTFFFRSLYPGNPRAIELRCSKFFSSKFSTPKRKRRTSSSHN